MSLTRALLLIFVVRTLLAALIPLSNDEAYYWTWSKNLALSYYDHPAMVALFIKVGTSIFGDNPFGIRIVGIAATTLISYIYYGFTGSKWGALALQATLIFGVALNFITPDTPLLFFWVLALFFITYNYWIPAGLFIGLAFTSKYSAALLGVGLIVWLLMNREEFKKPSLYIGGLVALLAASPVFIWNFQHDYVSFIKQSGRAFATAFNPISFLEMSFGFLLLLTPLIAILTVKGIRRVNHPVIITTLPLLAFLIYKSVFDKVELNWAFPLVFAAVFLADKVDVSLKKWAIPTGFAISLLALLLIFTHPFKLPPNLTDQLYGWKKAVEDIKNITGEKPIFTAHYTTNAQIRYAFKSLKPQQINDSERYLHEPLFRTPKSGDFLVAEKRHLIEMPFKLEQKGEIKMNNFSLFVFELK